MPDWIAAWADSMAHYRAGEVSRKYPAWSGAPTLATGSDGQPWLRCAAGDYAQAVQPENHAPAAAVTWGAAFTIAPLPADTRLVLAEDWQISRDGSGVAIAPGDNRQLALHLTEDGTLHLVRGATEIGASAAGAFRFDTRCYVELAACFDGSDGVQPPLAAGSAQLYVDGVSVASFFGHVAEHDTSTYNRATGLGVTGGANCVRLGNLVPDNAATVDLRDLYVLHQGGAVAFPPSLGPVRVAPVEMADAGSATAWTGSPAPNWAAVAELLPDDATSVVLRSFTDLTRRYDYYTPAALPAAVTAPGAVLHFVQSNTLATQPTQSLTSIVVGGAARSLGQGTLLDQEGGIPGALGAWGYRTSQWERPPGTATGTDWATAPAAAWADTEWGPYGQGLAVTEVTVWVTQFVLEVVYTGAVAPPSPVRQRAWAWLLA